ncbi:MAG: Holliday junction resolvase Hjc [Candidatus Anstonellales archaeon]
MTPSSRKGSRSERELINYFSQKGFSVIRAAGSGANSLSPDLLAFKAGKQYAIECKAHEGKYLHIQRKQFLLLKSWEENTGITTYIAWRVSRAGWFFLFPSYFRENKDSYSISFAEAERLGKRKEELV